MFNLKNWRIASKVLLIVAIMAAATVTVSMVGSWGLSKMESNAEQVAAGGDKMRMGANLMRNLVEIGRAEYSIVADPSNAQEHIERIAEARIAFDDRLNRLKTAVEGTDATDMSRRIAEAEGFARDYLAGVDRLLVTLESTGNVELSAAQQRLLSAARANREISRQARDTFSGLVDRVETEVGNLTVEVSNEAAFLSTLMIVVAVVGIAAGIALGYSLARFGIGKPLHEIIGGLNKLAENDLSVNIAGGDRGDEVGDIARAMEVFKENALERRRLEEAQRSEDEAKVARAEAVDRMVADFESSSAELLRSLAAAAEEMNATAGAMAETAQRTSDQSTMASAAAQQTGSNVQSVAAATEEMTNSIGEIGVKIHETAEMIRSAAGAMDTSESRMKDLSSAVSEIGTVISLITEIAEQTNLLALNATIEAARAGEAGKGFAVVASEVKNLANQTHKATEEVRVIIQKIETGTEETAGAIRSVVQEIEKVNETAAAISAATEEQTAATHEISRNVQEAAAGTENVTQNIGQVASATDETRSAAEQVLQVAGALSQQAETMNTQIRTFLADIKAA